MHSVLRHQKRMVCGGYDIRTSRRCRQEGAACGIGRKGSSSPTCDSRTTDDRDCCMKAVLKSRFNTEMTTA